MSHYYDQTPSSVSKERLISFEVCGTKISLYTDNGVFSKGELDFGTRVLIETILEEELSGKILYLGCVYGVIGIILNKFKQILFLLLKKKTIESI